jgi:hypothetical protein
MTLRNLNNLIKTPGLIIDGRSITQVLYIYSVFGSQFRKKNTILIWKGNKKDLLFLSKIIKIPEHSYVVNIKSIDQDLALNFKAVKELKILLGSLRYKCSEYSLCTCFASGLYFEIIKVFLGVKNKNVMQFDDGVINEYVVKRKYRLFRFLVNLIHGFIYYPSKYKLFSDIRYNSIFTSISPKNIHSRSSKYLVNINLHVKNLFKGISAHNIPIDIQNSAIFMTAPLVESGRMKKSEYQKLILKAVEKIKNLGFKKIYLSKHPSEEKASDIFYRTIGLDFSYANFPSEIIIMNKNIRAIGNPLNSTLFLSKKFDLLRNIKIVVSYFPTNAPFIVSRISAINNLLVESNVPHHMVTIDE